MFLITSISLSADTGEASPVDIFGNGGEHFRVDSEISDWLELSLLHGHSLSGEAFAHTLGLYPALFGVDAASSVVAALPANSDGGIVAGLLWTYKAKVSMQAA
jgi:hypothetical protein